jgi:hypothetical protein
MSSTPSNKLYPFPPFSSQTPSSLSRTYPHSPSFFYSPPLSPNPSPSIYIAIPIFSITSYSFLISNSLPPIITHPTTIFKPNSNFSEPNSKHYSPKVPLPENVPFIKTNQKKKIKKNFFIF